MLQETTTAKIRSIAQPVLSDMRLELVDLEFKREGGSWILRFFIDKEGGVTLDDCAAFSREIDVVLEIEDLIPAAYRLEVSSPGLDRPLKKREDFRRFVGERVKIKMHDQLDPDNRGHLRKTFVGELLGLDGDSVRIRQGDKRGGIVELAFDGIEKAHLDPEL
jgi:ribosome maturation factor RimP